MENQWPIYNRVREVYVNFSEDLRNILADPNLLFCNNRMNRFKSILLGIADTNTELGKLDEPSNTLENVDHTHIFEVLGNSALEDYYKKEAMEWGSLGFADPNTELGKLDEPSNTLENVDRTHIFEVLGNSSFGDYYKKEAIEWAWNLLTKVINLPSDRIYATYFGGDEEAGLPADIEAKDTWLKYLPSEHVVPCGYKENSWKTGDRGPCGTSSKIYYDRDGNHDAAISLDQTCVDLWEFVFLELNTENNVYLNPLPAIHIGTGILQPEMRMYDTSTRNALWSHGTVTFLVQEIAGGHTTLDQPEWWTLDRLNNITKKLYLLRRIVESSETARLSFLQDRGYLPLFPYLSANSTTDVDLIDLLRLAALEVLLDLVKAEYRREEIHRLVYDGLVHHCAKSLLLGSTPSLRVALPLLEKILRANACIIYIMVHRELLTKVLNSLEVAMSQWDAEYPDLSILAPAIHCFLLLSRNESIRDVVRRYVSKSLLRHSHHQLLAMTDYSPEVVQVRSALYELQDYFF